MNLSALRQEITNDPLARGYSGMTDKAVADDLNTAYRTREKPALSGSTIFNAIVPSEFGALSADQSQFVRDVFSLGDVVDVRPGTNARTVLLTAFGAGTVTRDNLAAAVVEDISRAQELGLPHLQRWHVTKVRN